MYIFRRTRIMNPATAAEAKSLALELAQTTSAITGRTITAFEVVLGGPDGAINWTTPVRGLADIAEMTAKLESAVAYQKLITKAAGLFIGNREDALTDILVSGITQSDLQYYGSLSSVVVPERAMDAMAFGVELQGYLQSAGYQTVFGSSPYGPYGEVGWLFGATDAGEVDKMHEFVKTDPGLAALAGKAAGLFVVGSGVRRLVRRLG